MRQRVGVFILNNGDILLIHRVREGKEYYAVPGGGVEERETVEEAAIREIKEETGLDIILGDNVGALEADGEKEIFFVAKSFTGEVSLGGPERERNSPANSYQLEWIARENLRSLNFRPEIREILEKVRAM